MRIHAPAFAASLVLLVLASAASSPAQQSGDAKPQVSPKPLTAEQLSVYNAVLGNWMEREMSSLNLAIPTVPLDSTGPMSDEECVKGLVLEPLPPGLVHRFRPQDLPQLAGPGKTLVLVDPDRQRKEVRDNDPERTVGEGSSIEDAVRNGFAHGLVTLSEIQFNKDHTVAVVSYGFYCGSLCGNGGTAVLTRTKTGWHRGKQCHDWIS